MKTRVWKITEATDTMTQVQDPVQLSAAERMAGNRQLTESVLKLFVSGNKSAEEVKAYLPGLMEKSNYPVQRVSPSTVRAYFSVLERKGYLLQVYALGNKPLPERRITQSGLNFLAKARTRRQ